MTESPSCKVYATRPSATTSSLPERVLGDDTVSTDEEEKTTGGVRYKVWGQMGIKEMTCSPASRIAPPAAKLWAVEPVGVENRSPSAW